MNSSFTSFLAARDPLLWFVFFNLELILGFKIGLLFPPSFLRCQVPTWLF